MLLSLDDLKTLEDAQSELNAVVKRILFRVALIIAGITVLLSRPIVAGGFSWYFVLIGIFISYFLFGKALRSTLKSKKTLEKDHRAEKSVVTGIVSSRKESTSLGLTEVTIRSANLRGNFSASDKLVSSIN